MHSGQGVSSSTSPGGRSSTKTRSSRALEQGHLAGAGLDVFADEPHVPEALLQRDDVVLLPHLASGTVETRAAMVALVLENVEEFLARGRLVTPV